MSRRYDFFAWTGRAFGDKSQYPRERALRLFEEATELAQAAGVEQNYIDDTVKRVYGRMPGDLRQEYQQVALLLEGFSVACGFEKPSEAAAKEWSRILPIPMEHWHARHKAKAEQGITTDTPRE